MCLSPEIPTKPCRFRVGLSFIFVWVAQVGNSLNALKKNAVGELIEAEFPHPRAGARHGVPAVSLGNGSSGLASAPANPPLPLPKG